MIVGGDAIAVMSPLRFLFYMSLPSIVSYLLTMLWIQRCWMKKRSSLNINKNSNALITSTIPLSSLSSSFHHHQQNSEHNSEQITTTNHHNEKKLLIDTEISTNNFDDQNTSHSNDHHHNNHNHRIRVQSGLLSPFRPDSLKTLSSPISTKSTPVSQQVMKFIITPFPYAMLILMAFMIALIFVDIISIFGLICLTAVIMVVILVLGNHWQGLPIWGTTTSNELESLSLLSSSTSPTNQQNNQQNSTTTTHFLTAEEKSKNTNEFFEDLFNSLDYNLLFIFLGLFVVVENIDSTGIPNKIWNSIVGKNPFNTFLSVTLISLFVLISSQFLGNVPVIQLAKPNVETLDDNEKRYAWAVLSFVATVGGNLTITGSAANIIVAEKAARIDPTSQMDFFTHYKICFWITLLSCVLGSLIITGIVVCDNHMN